MNCHEQVVPEEPEEGWFGQPKYSTNIYVNSTFYPFRLKKKFTSQEVWDLNICTWGEGVASLRAVLSILLSIFF